MTSSPLATEPDTVTGTISDVEILPFEDTEDGTKRLAHIVRPVDNGYPPEMKESQTITAKDVIDMARLSGTEVVALCGHRWVPTHDPAKHDTCMACLHVAEQIMSNQRF